MRIVVVSGGHRWPCQRVSTGCFVTHAMTVTDTNIIEMAEAFVSVAVGNGLITGRGGYQRRPATSTPRSRSPF